MVEFSPVHPVRCAEREKNGFGIRAAGGYPEIATTPSKISDLAPSDRQAAERSGTRPQLGRHETGKRHPRGTGFRGQRTGQGLSYIGALAEVRDSGDVSSS